jgi:hypothetical protein
MDRTKPQWVPSVVTLDPQLVEAPRKYAGLGHIGPDNSHIGQLRGHIGPRVTLDQGSYGVTLDHGSHWTNQRSHWTGYKVTLDPAEPHWTEG